MRAESLLSAHRDVLSQLAGRLLKAESLDGSEVREVLAGVTPVVAEGASPAGAVPSDQQVASITPLKA
jgi:hypothetical protein